MNDDIFSWPPAVVFRKLNYINPQTLDIDKLINSVLAMPYIFFKVPYYVWTDRITDQAQCNKLSTYLGFHKDIVRKEISFHRKHLLVFQPEFWRALDIRLKRHPLSVIEVATFILHGYDPRYLIDRYRCKKRWFQTAVARCIAMYMLSAPRRIVLPITSY